MKVYRIKLINKLCEKNILKNDYNIYNNNMKNNHQKETK